MYRAFFVLYYIRDIHFELWRKGDNHETGNDRSGIKIQRR